MFLFDFPEVDGLIIRVYLPHIIQIHFFGRV